MYNEGLFIQRERLKRFLLLDKAESTVQPHHFKNRIVA